MANYALAPLAVVLASVVAGVAAQPPYSDVNELGLDINGAWECPCLTRQHPGVEEVSKLNVAQGFPELYGLAGCQTYDAAPNSPAHKTATRCSGCFCSKSTDQDVLSTISNAVADSRSEQGAVRSRLLQGSLVLCPRGHVQVRQAKVRGRRYTRRALLAAFSDALPIRVFCA